MLAEVIFFLQGKKCCGFSVTSFKRLRPDFLAFFFLIDNKMNVCFRWKNNKGTGRIKFMARKVNANVPTHISFFPV